MEDPARSYDDPCGIARALDLVGERWALLVVRELVLGPKRFVDLRAGLGKLSANVLARRLHQLEEAGVITRRALPPPAASRVYELTERGHDLEPVLLALGRWGSRAAFPAGAQDIGADAVMLALPTLFDPSAVQGFHAVFEIQFGADTFYVEVEDGALEVSREARGRIPGATIHTEPSTFAAMLWHGGDLSAAESITGDRASVDRLLTLFPQSAPA